jgi:hypothetical protein
MVEFGTGLALAIDFGSSNTAAAFRDRHGHVQEVRLSATGTLMPSGVFFDGSRFLVGRTALQAAFTSPEAFEPSPKRRLADREIFLAGNMVPVTKMVAAVFAEVLAKASGVMGGAPDVIVVTHPDQWSGPLQELLAEGARAGGVDANKMRMVSEAQAAAWFYAKSAPTEVAAGSRLVVFDFGAGTCDVAVLDKQPDQTFAVIASDGLDGLGGHDLDARIQAWVRRQLAVADPVLLAEVNEPVSIATRLTLNDRIRDAKEALSEASSAAIVVAAGAHTQVLQLTRDEFDELVGPDIDRAVQLTKRVMVEAVERIPSGQTPTIYLTGGSSHIPLVHSRLAELGPLGVLGDPKTVVVQGALGTPAAAPAGPPQPPPPQTPPIGASDPATSPPPQPTAAGTALSIAGMPPAPAQPGARPLPPTPSQSAPGTPASRSRAWLVAGSVLATLVIAAVVIVLTTGVFNGKKPPPPPPTSTLSLVAATNLGQMLLSVGQIGAIMHSSAMVGLDINNQLSAVQVKVSQPNCLASLYGSQPSTYVGSGYTGVSDQVVKETGADNSLKNLVEQTAVGYPSADAAKTFFDKSSTTWKACAGQNVALTETNTDGVANQYSWNIEEVKSNASSITQIATQEAGNGWACQHALGNVSNVIVDVDACSPNITNEGGEIAAKMVTNAS